MKSWSCSGRNKPSSSHFSHPLSYPFIRMCKCFHSTLLCWISKNQLPISNNNTIKIKVSEVPVLILGRQSRNWYPLAAQCCLDKTSQIWGMLYFVLFTSLQWILDPYISSRFLLIWFNSCSFLFLDFSSLDLSSRHHIIDVCPQAGLDCSWNQHICLKTNYSQCSVVSRRAEHENVHSFLKQLSKKKAQ